MNTVATIPTPIGELTLAASETALTGVYFPGRHKTRGRAGSNEVLENARQQLAEYFERARTSFELPLDAAGTEFERRVWQLLRDIPYGTTTSYGDLARRLGEPKDARAVGAANGKNPIPIIVPCHRVIGANGDLTGFGGGLDRKRWLLEHEGALLRLGALCLTLLFTSIGTPRSSDHAAAAQPSSSGYVRSRPIAARSAASARCDTPSSPGRTKCGRRGGSNRLPGAEPASASR